MPLFSQALRKSLNVSMLGLAMISVVACGGGGGSSDLASTESSNSNPSGSSLPATTTVAITSTSTIATPSAGYVATAATQTGLEPLNASAIYAASHRTQFANQSLKIYAVGDNVVKLSGISKLAVNDTVEFEDTIIKITSVISDNVYGYTEAQLADVFSKFEIDGSMGMSPQNVNASSSKESTSVAVDPAATAAATATAAADILVGLYELGAEIKGRNCVPTLYPSPVNVVGDATNHRNKVGEFTGRKISLVDCEVY